MGNDMTTDLPGTMELPLSGLKLSADNVRRGGKADLEQLAADILAHGVLQNLLVVPTDGGAPWQVIAGGRRLRALQLLQRRKEIDGMYMVPVRVVSGSAREYSLAENVQRLEMNAAEEARAYALLADEGLTAAQVAHRFGVSELHVKQRLRLARLHPNVLDRLHKGAITLEAARAFASVDDPERQAEVLKEVGKDPHPGAIRNRMQARVFDATDSQALYAGREAYLAAGGRCDRDLFTEDGEELWLDGAIIERLARARGAVDARAMAGRHGLADCIFGLSYGEQQDAVGDRARYPVMGSIADLPADVRAQLIVSVGINDAGDGLELCDWPGPWLADGGTSVAAEDVDDPDVEQALGEIADEAAANDAAADAEDEGVAISQALRGELNMRRRDVLALALMDDVQLARDFALFQLCEQAGRRWSQAALETGTCIGASTRDRNDPIAADKVAWEGDALDTALAKARGGSALDDSWRHLENIVDRWHAFQALPVEQRLHWAAAALGETLVAQDARIPLLSALAANLGGVDVLATTWRPTVANYFGRVPKPKLLEFLVDVFGDDAPVDHCAKWKKAELAVACEALAAGDAGKFAGLHGKPAGEIEGYARVWLPKEMQW